jgi:hypothetical protein
MNLLPVKNILLVIKNVVADALNPLNIYCRLIDTCKLSKPKAKLLCEWYEKYIFKTLRRLFE